jgi:hypothetical protein
MVVNMSRYMLNMARGQLLPRNKYGVAPKELRTYNRQVYASKAEANRAFILDRLLRAIGPGAVERWERQPRFQLGTPLNVYVADFLVHEADGSVHAEDVKGFRTAAFNKNVRLWKAYGPMPLWILTPSGNGRWNVEIIEGATAPGKDSEHARTKTA